MGRSDAFIDIEDSCDHKVVLLWEGKVGLDLVVPTVTVL